MSNVGLRWYVCNSENFERQEHLNFTMHRQYLSFLNMWLVLSSLLFELREVGTPSGGAKRRELHTAIMLAASRSLLACSHPLF